MDKKPAPPEQGQEQQASPAGAKTATPGGAVDVQKLIDAAYKDVPANLREPLERIVLSGMRILFDKQSHQMMLEELDKPGPLAERLSNGMISLMYMLWQKSNQSMPPQLIIPATLILTLHAFDFLQKTEEPDATKENLGEAVNMAIAGILERFGAKPEQLQALRGGPAGAPAPAALAAPAAGGGMIDSMGAQ